VEREDVMFVEETIKRAKTTSDMESRSFLIEALAAVSVCSVEKVISQDEESMRSTIQSAESDTVVLDFAQVDCMDSSRLGMLVAVARYASARGTQLKLMNLHPEVFAVLKQNNLFEVFEICSPREVINLWCRAVCHIARADESSSHARR
jgi:anti-anti-sigma factor